MQWYIFSKEWILVLWCFGSCQPLKHLIFWCGEEMGGQQRSSCQVDVFDIPCKLRNGTFSDLAADSELRPLLDCLGSPWSQEKAGFFPSLERNTCECIKLKTIWHLHFFMTFQANCYWQGLRNVLWLDEPYVHLSKGKELLLQDRHGVFFCPDETILCSIGEQCNHWRLSVTQGSLSETNWYLFVSGDGT